MFIDSLVVQLWCNSAGKLVQFTCRLRVTGWPSINKISSAQVWKQLNLSALDLLAHHTEQGNVLPNFFFFFFFLILCHFFIFQKFREAIQTILRTAKEKKVSSIAIPSLGIGNLHFPASVSARIIYEEILSFRGQIPQLSLNYVLVIFESKHYKEFSKVHAQKNDNTKMVKKVGYSFRLIQCLGVPNFLPFVWIIWRC